MNMQAKKQQRKGIEVRIIRRRAGLTQAEFAKEIGAALRTVQFWELTQMDRFISAEANQKIDKFLEGERECSQ